MLGLAVGIDYSLFIASRHRQQLLNGMAPIDSVALAVGTAGGAVCFAGLTVVIALVGMIVLGIPFLSVMGLAAAGTVIIEMLAALTLLPALLGFLGARVAQGRRAPHTRRMESVVRGRHSPAVADARRCDSRTAGDRDPGDQLASRTPQRQQPAHEQLRVPRLPAADQGLWTWL